jgi:hypothetical protein
MLPLLTCAGLTPIKPHFQQQQQRGGGAMTSAGRKLELEVVDIENPKEYNFILGHGEAVVQGYSRHSAKLCDKCQKHVLLCIAAVLRSHNPVCCCHCHCCCCCCLLLTYQRPAAHFIKTVEDIYEALVQSSTALKFGIAFNEASPGYEAMPGDKWL